MSFSLVTGVLSAAVMTIAGCGGGGSGSPANPSPTPIGGGGGGGATIAIAGIRGSQSFNPNPATVVQGASVAWVNADGVTHRLMANDGSFDTGNIAPGATSSALTLRDDGANYHCTIHPSMVGSINRSSGTPPPCQGAYCSSPH
jgi:plastocyanin